MSTRRMNVLLTTLTAVLLAGCAGTDTGAGSAPVASPSDLASSTPVEPSTDPDNPVPRTSEKPTKPALPEPGVPTGRQTLTGTVAAGVEPGCLVLEGAGGNYLLIFSGQVAGRAAATVGARVTVVGQADPEMVTTCQQGTPFVVSEVRPG